LDLTARGREGVKRRCETESGLIGAVRCNGSKGET